MNRRRRGGRRGRRGEEEGGSLILRFHHPHPVLYVLAPHAHRRASTAPRSPRTFPYNYFMFGLLFAYLAYFFSPTGSANIGSKFTKFLTSGFSGTAPLPPPTAEPREPSRAAVPCARSLLSQPGPL